MRLTSLPHDAGHDREGHAFCRSFPKSQFQEAQPSTIVFCSCRVQPLQRRLMWQGGGVRGPPRRPIIMGRGLGESHAAAGRALAEDRRGAKTAAAINGTASKGGMAVAIRLKKEADRARGKGGCGGLGGARPWGLPSHGHPGSDGWASPVQYGVCGGRGRWAGLAAMRAPQPRRDLASSGSGRRSLSTSRLVRPRGIEPLFAP